MARVKKDLKKLERDIVTRQTQSEDAVTEPEIEEEERLSQEDKHVSEEGMGIEEEEKAGQEPYPEIEEELKREDKTDSDEEED